MIDESREVYADPHASWREYLEQMTICRCGRAFIRLRIYLGQWQCAHCGKLREDSGRNNEEATP